MKPKVILLLIIWVIAAINCNAQIKVNSSGNVGINESDPDR